MARCNDCNKFVGYEGEEDPDVTQERFHYDPDTGFVKFDIEVTRPLNCIECSGQLKEASFSFEQEMLPPIEKGLDPEELELEVEASAAEIGGRRVEYGVSIIAHLKRNDEILLTYEAEDTMPASQFDEY